MYQANCAGQPDIYNSKSECLAACATFPIANDVFATGGDSVECRIYHAGVSLFDPDTHCSHASRHGGGVCVEPPSAYCTQYCDGWEASTVCTLTDMWTDKQDCLTWCALI